MISIKSKNTIESVAVPGVTFTVRTLNKLQRAARDLPVADKSAESDRLGDEWRALQPEGYFTDLPPAFLRKAAAETDLANASDENREARQAEVDAATANLEAIQKRIDAVDTPENIRARGLINYKATLLDSAFLQPAAIRAGLVSIEGLQIDGKSATAETLLASAGADYDLLIDEIWRACTAASGLTPAERKNSESPTTSSGPVATEPTTSTVAPAGN